MNKSTHNFGTALSREQMKKIMGGCDITELCDNGGGGAGGGACSTSSCIYFDSPNSTIPRTGTCTTNTNPMQTGCACKRADGTMFAESGCNM